MPFDNVPVKKPLSPETYADLRVLRLTRDHIKAGQWCKGQYTDDRQFHCVVGWLRHIVVGEVEADRLAAVYLAPLIPEACCDVYTTFSNLVRKGRVVVTSFNDHRDITRLDVVNLIDRAIARAEENADAV